MKELGIRLKLSALQPPELLVSGTGFRGRLKALTLEYKVLPSPLVQSWESPAASTGIVAQPSNAKLPVKM